MKPYRSARGIIFVLILAILLCACGKKEAIPEWQEQYDLGVRYLSEGNYEEAILMFSAVIEIDPKQIPAYTGRAEAYIKSGATSENYRKALTDYETILSMDDTITAVWINMANLYEQLDGPEKALEFLKSGLDKAGDNAAILARIAELESNLEQTATERPDAELGEDDKVVYENVSLVNWLGKTTDDLINQFGQDYHTDYWEGGKYIAFTEISAMFFYDEQSNIVFSVVAGKDERLVYNLTAGMTYPELVAAAPEGTLIPEPEYWYNQMDDREEYSVYFEVGGLRITYSWLADPYSNAAYTVSVSGNPPVDAAETAIESSIRATNLLLFTDIPEKFILTSGAGAWSTEITLSSDGSFTGGFHDIDVGDTEVGYPKGTVYYCEFEGKFSEPVQVNQYTYRMDLERLNVHDTEGSEYIQDDVRYVSSIPYGFDGVTEYYIYLPGIPQNMMPEGCFVWISRLFGRNVADHHLYVICSEKGELPFCSDY